MEVIQNIIKTQKNKIKTIKLYDNRIELDDTKKIVLSTSPYIGRLLATIVLDTHKKTLGIRIGVNWRTLRDIDNFIDQNIAVFDMIDFSKKDYEKVCVMNDYADSINRYSLNDLFWLLGYADVVDLDRIREIYIHRMQGGCDYLCDNRIYFANWNHIASHTRPAMTVGEVIMDTRQNNIYIKGNTGDQIMTLKMLGGAKCINVFSNIQINKVCCKGCKTMNYINTYMDICQVQNRQALDDLINDAHNEEIEKDIIKVLQAKKIMPK